MTLPTLKLGQTLRDAVTGFQGIAVQRTEFMNGNVQYSLQQPIKDGAYPLSESIDHHMLDVVDGGVSERAGKATFQSPVKLGNEVECIVTGLKGTAVLKTNYLNGCAAYLVSSKIEKGDDGSVSHKEDWVDQTRLKVLSNGIAEQVIQPPVAEETGKRPGGPNQRGIPRFC